MLVLLDTDICIYLIREQPETLIKQFDRYAVGDVGISTITLAELEYGISKSSKPARNKEALDQFTTPLVVADFDRPATAAYGKLRAALEKRRHMIGGMDLLIAAHAVSLSVPIVTHNVREFRSVPGLRVETWN
jgi:tRNA(fMet)-specific endonuclease VapC